MSHVSEKLFLAKSIPEGLEKPFTITDTYLGFDDEIDRSVRLRFKTGPVVTTHTLRTDTGKNRVLTKMSMDDFTEQLANAGERQVIKHRHMSRERGLSIGLDVYGGGLVGLALAGVRFVTEEAESSFKPKEWMGDEVTGVPFFEDRNLVRLNALEFGDYTVESGQKVFIPRIEI